MTRLVRILERDFLHVADCPRSIEVLLALRGGRDWRPIGMHVERNGLDVCWESLLDSYLSSTEKATIRLVQAVVRIEGRGGFPSRVQSAVSALMEDLSGRSEGRVARLPRGGVGR
jgi:hypothetical protein